MADPPSGPSLSALLHHFYRFDPAEWLMSMYFSLVHGADEHARTYDRPREEVLRLLLRTARSVFADADAPRQRSEPR